MGEEKKKSLSDEIRKKYGKNSFISSLDDPPLEVISSGILSVDYVSGVGGFPKGMNTVLEGLPSSGKTEIALDWAKHYLSLDPNNRVCFIDVENRLKKDRLIGRGIDLTRFDIARCAVAERVFDMMCDLIVAGEHGTIIVDSIAMLIPSADFAQEIEDNNKPGTQGKALSNGFKKLGAKMMEVGSRCINIFINQCQANIGAKQWEPKTMPKSGFAPKYLSSFTIEVERLTGKERVKKTANGEQVGNDVKLTVRKNSLSRFQSRKATFHLNYETGPLIEHELLNLGLGYGLITDHGRGSYTINEKNPISVRGYDALLERLETDIDLQNFLKQKIQDKIKNGEQTVDTEEFTEI